MNTRRDRFSIILVTIVVALVLTLLPLPPVLNIMQPYWVALVIIYWGLETQDLISLGLAFMIGVTLDLSESRVSQMHSAIVERLRFQMRHRGKESPE